MPKNNGILQITLNLTLASLISGAVLASVYFITAPFAEKQRVNFKNQTMKELIASVTNFKPIKGKEDWFLAEKEGRKIGTIIPSEAKGYGGAIKILIAVDTNNTIMDFKILSHNETPGLGDQAALPGFRNQFRGKTITNMEVVKKHDENKIDAITGATITSRAVTKAVKEGLERLEEWEGLKE
jgi:electron transport complex protein RnfG